MVGKRFIRRFIRYAKKDTWPARIIDRLIYTTKRLLAYICPDKVYVSLYFFAHHGRIPNWQQPLTFNDKIQWLKLNYRPKQLIQLVDKLAVRDYVAKRVGPEALIPLHQVFDHVSQIDWNALPQAFALKPTHGSGWVILCKDKQQLDIRFATYQLTQWMQRNYYYHAREWAYRYVRPQIICEQLLADDQGQIPSDYKLFCFNGNPHIVQVDLSRFSQHRQNFFDPHWNRMDFSLLYPATEQHIPRPGCLDKMIEIARKLSADFPFCRVDLYVAQEHVYFGELTFLPSNGIAPFNPPTYDQRFGQLLQLPPQPVLK